MWNLHFPFWIQGHWVLFVVPFVTCTPSSPVSRGHIVGLPRPLHGRPVLEAAWNTHIWFSSVLFWYFGQPAHFKNKAQVLLPVSSGPGLAALDFTWRILPALKTTAFTNSNQISQQVEWGGLKLLVIFKAKATSVVISTSYFDANS